MAKKLITVLLSALLIWSLQQNTPVHKSFADKASVIKTTVAPKASTAPKDTQVQPVTPQVETPVATPPVPTTHDELMAAANINPKDYGAVSFIVSKESGWRTTAVNPSSGSCGLVQELPCGKSGCTLGDGVCQLRWASQYATQRYGSWWGAQAFWSAHSWW